MKNANIFTNVAENLSRNGEIFENFMTETVYVCSLTHIKGWVKKKKDNSRVAPRPPENMRAHFSSLIQFLRQYRGTRGVETSFSLFFSLSLSEAMWTRSVPLYYFFSVFLLFLISVYNVCVQCTVIFGGDITFSFIFFHSTSSFRCRLSQQETKFLIRDYGAIAEWDGKKFARGERWKKFSTRWYKTMEHLTNTKNINCLYLNYLPGKKGARKRKLCQCAELWKWGIRENSMMDECQKERDDLEDLFLFCHFIFLLIFHCLAQRIWNDSKMKGLGVQEVSFFIKIRESI